METKRTFSTDVARLIMEGWKVYKDTVDSAVITNPDNQDYVRLVQNEEGTWQKDKPEFIAEG